MNDIMITIEGTQGCGKSMLLEKIRKIDPEKYIYVDLYRTTPAALLQLRLDAGDKTLLLIKEVATRAREI